MPKVATLNQLHPLDCLFVQAVRVEYGNANWYYDRGYIHYQDGDGCWLDYEHRLVARLAHGLPDRYHVHHIDGVFVNNRADNLLPVTPSDHARIHAGPVIAAELACDWCGSRFVRAVSCIRYDAHYCSRSCSIAGSHRTSIPDAETLFDLMCSVSNWTALGCMFGVSDNAVRKWAKRYKLDLSVCDGRRR